MDLQLCCLWQPASEGARLVRVLGETPCPVLPQALAGHTVAEIGPYCFAPVLRGVSGPVFATMGSATREFSDTAQALAALALPEIAGSFVQNISLPAGVQQLNNAAFYNCRALQTLSFGAALRRVGSDCFTNCFALQTLTVCARPGEATGLGKVLASITAPITAQFMGNPPAAQLFFPEYSDDHPENGPAHIFMHEFQGAGYLFRQCFGLSGEVHFAEYDACFARAEALETPETLCRIALSRLRFPAGLSSACAESYRAACRRHADVLAAWLLAEQALPALEFVCREALLCGEALGRAAEMAARQNQPQAAALLLRFAAPAVPAAKRYDFDF